MEFTKEDRQRIEAEEAIREEARERIKAKRELPDRIAKFIFFLVILYFAIRFIRELQYASYNPFEGIPGL